MDNQKAIERTIETYFACMYESSASKARDAFHPDARITGFMDGELRQMTVDQFAKFVDSQPSAKAAGLPARLDILSIQIAGATAVALVRDDYLGMTFLDTLCLIQEDNDWSIYTKLFHIEGQAPGE